MRETKRAMICGISGQDGAYLARLLLNEGYEVFGTSRDAHGSSFDNLRRLGIVERVSLLSMDPNDFHSVMSATLKHAPDEIYFLAGQSSVGLSFELPTETIRGSVMGTLNMLEACRMVPRPFKLFCAGSSECFGDSSGKHFDEGSPFHPQSPYAVAKASSYWLVDNYRRAYGVFACTGILFNHESPLRPPRFVTRKIISTALRIAHGSGEVLKLGRLDIARDWGWAPEYVVAMWKMLQLSQPEDFVLATGQVHTLESFVDTAFSSLKLDWRDHVVQEPAFFRPTDPVWIGGNPEKAWRLLEWKAERHMEQVVREMIRQEEALDPEE